MSLNAFVRWIFNNNFTCTEKCQCMTIILKTLLQEFKSYKFGVKKIDRMQNAVHYNLRSA